MRYTPSHTGCMATVENMNILKRAFNNEFQKMTLTLYLKE